jgi:predicted Zn-dependent protease
VVKIYRQTRWLLAVALCFGFLAPPVARADKPVPAAESVVLRALREELARGKEILGQKGDPPPYFIGYQVTDLQYSLVSASFGALRNSTGLRQRLLDVEVRVGDYDFDNTRQIRGDGDTGQGGYVGSVSLPLEDDADALKSQIWLRTDARYREAVERLSKAKTNQAVTVKEENPAPDFSRETPNTAVYEPAKSKADVKDWAAKAKEVSAVFKKYPELLNSEVTFYEEAVTKYIVNTEGAKLQFGAAQARIAITASAKADDGMELFRYEIFDARAPEGLPAMEALKQAAEKVAQDVTALRKAPVVEPFTGPAILSGRAAGVFFHEIFGHRIEGHRQKNESEGNTFTKQVGKEILPRFISVYDDPTLEKLGRVDLGGHYLFDDEGVKAQRVPVVEKGLLRNFLLSRSPLPNFPVSNGHGRKSPGFVPVGRQGNLLVQSSVTVPKPKLRQMLIAECRRQKKPFGLLFDDVSGGFTITGRNAPQAFQITPIMVYRVYADGRADELVRGVDLIGTPLTAFSKIIAASDTPEVFNGVCGAESGWVPVSAISPALLLQQIEVQKKPKSSDLKPILPPPN